MSTPAKIDWNSGFKEAMISIGAHSVYLSASGPDRKAGQPAVLLMQGLGSRINEWSLVRRLVTHFARWINYDRSGLGRSETPPDTLKPITAVSVALELDTLLKISGIEGPFLIVCHSWGGITSREFLHLRPNDVAGMVFVDANSENTFDGGPWPLQFADAIMGDQQWTETSGLAAEQVFSKEEWEQIKKTSPRDDITEAAEAKGYKTDQPTLASKNQFEKKVLGDKPLSVLQANTPRDFQRVYDAGVAAGNGTEEERRLFRDSIKVLKERDPVWQQEILMLSNLSRFVTTVTSGHNVQMVEPELVVEEIRWVWDHIV